MLPSQATLRISKPIRFVRAKHFDVADYRSEITLTFSLVQEMHFPAQQFDTIRDIPATPGWYDLEVAWFEID